MAKIIGLGVEVIRFGVAEDAERIKKLVGEFKHWLDDGLDPDRFAVSEQDPEEWCSRASRAGIAGWPVDEEDKERQEAELLAANFGKGLPDYAAVLEEAAAAKELEDCLRGGFPHLATQLSVPKVDQLYQKGIPWLEATDENSLWRGGGGSLYAPFVRCGPGCRGLSARWVADGRGRDGWFLFVRELMALGPLGY